MFPLHDANPRHGPSYVVIAVVAINLLVFLYQFTLDSPFRLFAFVASFGFIPAEFFRSPFGEASTLVTSMFLHGGWWHLIGNLFFLYVFGDNIEDRLGHGRFVLFYLLGGAVATLVHGLFSLGSPIPMIGASGAISAVMGAYIVLFPRQRVLTFIPPLLVPWIVAWLLVRAPRFFLLWLPAWVYIGYWAFIQFIEAAGGIFVPQSDMSGVAWWAHLGGFVFGLLTVRYFARPATRLT